MGDMRVRRLGPESVADCMRLGEGRGWSPDESKWRLLFQVGAVFGADAPDGDGLAGAVVVTPYGTRLAAIGMMLVAERYERRGLGGRLVRHGMAETRAATFALTATEFGRPLYERLGFRPHGWSDIYTGTYRSTGTSRAGDASSSVRRSRVARASELPVLRALDAEVLGADRGRLFDALPGCVSQIRVVEDRAGALVAFAALWQNAHGHQIGPVVAPDAETALGLLNELAAQVEGRLRIDADPERHPELAGWAGKHGLARVASTTAMACGEPLPGDRSRLFVAFMQALG